MVNKCEMGGGKTNSYYFCELLILKLNYNEEISSLFSDVIAARNSIVR